MRLAWATDIHLDCASEDVALEFCARIQRSGAESVLIGGDISTAPDLARHLAFLDAHLSPPAYFVLGNHDYYGGSVASVRAIAERSQTPTLRWLPEIGVVSLSDSVGLVGHGGWGDARWGRFLEDPVLLNDYVAIQDLRRAGAPPGETDVPALQGWDDREALQARLMALGDEAADTLRPRLEQALARHTMVIVLTHVPPFRESCWYEGRPTGDEGLPGFTCKAMGDLLLGAASARPEREILVLCGHTHEGREARLRANLRVKTGAARYGQPDFVSVEI